MWEEKKSFLGPSFECLSTIAHKAFMCMMLRQGGVGGSRRQFSSRFDDTAD